MSARNNPANEGVREEPVVNEKAQKAKEELTNGMLMDQLEELEEQKTKLLLDLKECKAKYEQQKSDQTDIYYYLNKKLDENYETIALLEEQILTEQTQREMHEKKLEKRIEDLQLKLAADEVKYQAKLKDAEEKLQKLKEFSENKDELERNFENLLQTLEAERKHYAELVDENERKSIRERDRFRKECVAQFEEYKQKLQDEADDKLSSKTKKTLKTNKMIKTELTYQSKQADQVLVYNKKVLDKDRELRQELELAQTTQKEMVKRLALYQRLIKQLNEKVNAQETKVQDVMETASISVKEKDDTIELLRQQLKKSQQLPNRSNNQDAFFDFLSGRYKELAEKGGSCNKNTSKAAVKKNGDVIMLALVADALQHYPERFSHLLQMDEKAGGLFPPVHRGNSREAGDCHSSKQLLTGIAAWDSARSLSTKQNWWSALSNGESDGRSRDNTTSQAGIQTDGRIVHYPAGSRWLNSDDSGSSVGRDDKYFIAHERRHKKNSSKPAIESADIIVAGVPSSKGGAHREGGMFSPLGTGDPLHDRKRGDASSVGSSGASTCSRK